MPTVLGMSIHLCAACKVLHYRNTGLVLGESYERGVSRDGIFIFYLQESLQRRLKTML